MKIRKVLSLLISTLLVIGLIPTTRITILAEEISTLSTGRTIYLSSTGNDSNDGLTEAKAVQTLQEAYKLSQNGDIICVIDTVGISDTDNIVVTKEITIIGKPNAMIKRLSGNRSSLITIDSAGKLTLENIIIDGGTDDGLTADNSLIMINSGGNLITNVDSIIRNNNSASYGGGVFVSGNGTFTMNDGSISNNSANYEGGGVFVSGNGTFTMNGGSISSNSTSYEGGGVFVEGTFTMDGGSISSNSASYGGGGVFVKGIFTMNDGSISNNSSNYGGGVFVEGTFTMNGGSISSNSVSSHGGGIYLEGTFTMNDGSISNNSAYYGGGVFVFGTFSISGSSEIINNKNGNKPNNIYLRDGYFINLTSDFTGSAGVTLQKADSNNAKIGNATSEFSGISNIFSDENNNRHGVYDNGNIMWKYENAMLPTITTNLNTTPATYSKNATATPLSITANVTDGGTLTYQWYINTTNSTTGGTAISGATNDSYTPLTTTEGNFYYYVVITNTINNNGDGGTKIATTTSNVATIIVNQSVNADVPTITTNLNTTPATYSKNATATPLSITASVTDGGTLTYQWYTNTTNSTTGGTAISGATNDSYTPLTTTDGTFYYYVVITNTLTDNGDGGTKIATTTSNIATIVVNQSVNADVPTITTNLNTTPVIYSKNATATPLSITASVTDGGTLTYQWYTNTTNSTTGGTAISGATNDSYTPLTTTDGNFYYYVVITNTINNNGDGGVKTSTITSNIVTVIIQNNSNTPIKHTITASAGIGGKISPNGNIEVDDNGSQTFIITPNSNYSIKNVIVDGVSQGAIRTYTFNNITDNHVISAIFYEDYVPPVNTTPIEISKVEPTAEKTTQKVTIDIIIFDKDKSFKTLVEVFVDIEDTKINVNISDTVIKDAITKVKELNKLDEITMIILDLNVPKEFTSVKTTLTKSAMEELTKNIDNLEIQTPFSTLNFDKKSMENVLNTADGDIKININMVNKNTLSKELNNIVDEDPIYDFTVISGSKTISDFGNGKVIIKIPYTLAKNEKSSSMVVYYINKEEFKAVKASSYDEKSKMMCFITNYFSKYTIKYNPINFVDVNISDWFINSVDFTSSHELFYGIGENKFAPNAIMTRAMFITAIARLDNANITNYKQTPFSDVDINEWYGKSIAWAKDNKIIDSTNEFNPNEAITREDMAIILWNYINYKDITLEVVNEVPFSDINKVSNNSKTAVESMKKYGLIEGMGDNTYMPESTATRAEVATIFMNVIKTLLAQSN